MSDVLTTELIEMPQNHSFIIFVKWTNILAKVHLPESYIRFLIVSLSSFKYRWPLISSMMELWPNQESNQKLTFAQSPTAQPIPLSNEIFLFTRALQLGEPILVSFLVGFEYLILMILDMGPSYSHISSKKISLSRDRNI